ncbi:MAG: FAD-dependent oxidoreductase [Betaproteobacteria bacterium]|nr:FAD-dependent oxidoreductase [Betaproteobacteria bacterium]
MKKIAIIAGIALALGAWFMLGLDQYLSLDVLKHQQATFEQFYQANPLFVLAAFFAIYVVLTGLSVPGALIMTLAAGAVFGVTTGTLVVSFASAMGATLAFLASRYLLRDAVQSRFGTRLKSVDEGIARDGAFYLFSLRLVPVFPFFAVNLAMGLTSIRTWTFYWVSQLGMLLGTVVYVNAGTQLARINGLSDIASPGLLVSFAALGLLPWIGKWIMAAIRRRRVYARWGKPKYFDRNLVVIGAGAAGLVSSYIAATVKAKVTLVENELMGGDCLNYGCVPSKALIKSAKIAHQMRHAHNYGLSATQPSISFHQVMKRVHAVISEVEPHDSIERYRGLGVDVVQGYARIVDPWTVEISRHDGELQRLTTRSIVIAAGAEPVVPSLPGIDATNFFTTDTLWEEFARLDDIPRRIVVLGGGPIGCELSQAFSRLGADVTLVQRGHQLLPKEDTDAAEVVQNALEASGVRVLLGHAALRCEGLPNDQQLIAEGDRGETALPFDALVLAVGRRARLTGYGLEALGIDTKQTVVTDDYLATVFPNIYAAGDVAGPYQFTHTAAHQAWFASVNALFGQFRRFKADYRVIPWTTFTDPEVARVGLNEREAHERGIAFESTLFPLQELDRAIAESAPAGFVKVLTVPGKDRILGVTIVGEHAGELLAEYVLAMEHGLGLNKILATIHSYPTMAEANKYAAGEWKRQHAPEGLLRLVERYHTWRRG